MKKWIHLFWLVALALGFAAPVACSEETPEKPDGVVYIIPIEGMIEPALLYVIRRGVEEADEAQARAIVFVMNTPGGRLDAANEIVRLIQQISTPTITFVEKDAFSAGAIIALATKKIYMAPGSVIGDAMPIMMTPFGGVQELSESVEEKNVSAVAALIRAAAESGGHDPQLAEKMVRRETEYKIGDEVIAPAGQLLTLTNVKAESKVGPEGKPLLSSGTVKDLPELLETIGCADCETRELRVTAIERVARLIASMAPLFLIGGLLGIYIEIKTPGFGLPGILGMISLAIFFWGHHIAGLAGMEDLIVFGVGVALLLVEILVLPGFGVTGILGLTLIAWSLLSAMIQHYPGTPWYPTWPQIQLPLFKLSVSFVITAAVAMYLGRFLPDSPVFRRLVLSKSTSREDGFSASHSHQDMMGAIGSAGSVLRPSGTGLFGDRRVDVVTRGDFLPTGTPIRVVEVHGSRIVVEAAEPPSRSV